MNRVEVESLDALTAVLKAADKRQLVLVYFNAQWCKPCKSVTEALMSMKETDSCGIDTVYSVDAESEAGLEISKQYLVRNLPMVVIFKNGLPCSRLLGALAPAEYKRALKDKIFAELEAA